MLKQEYRLSAQDKGIIFTSISLISIGIFLFLYQFHEPGTFINEKSETFHFESSLPFRASSAQPGEYEITAKINLLNTRNRDLIVSVDDCLLDLFVNEQKIEIPFLPYCNWREKLRLTDVESLKIGENSFKVRIRNLSGPGGFDIRVTDSNTVKLTRWGLVSFGILILATLLAKFIRKSQHYSLVDGFFGLGCALRVLYFLATPSGVRAYDMHDHLLYVRHSLKTWALPSIVDGWEFNQVPLYYWLVSCFVRGQQAIGLPFGDIGESSLFVSLLLSLACLAIAYAALNSAVKDQTGKVSSVLVGSALLSTFPGLITTTVRVNNDSLAILMGTAFLWFTLRWWRTSENKWWFSAVVALSFGILSKLNILSLTPLLILLPILKPKLARNSRAICIAFGVILPAIVLMTYAFARFKTEGKVVSLIENGGIPSRIPDRKLRIERSKQSFLTFNPKAILDFPNVGPRTDEQRRWAFPEYFFKSAFFGEFKIHDHLVLNARAMLCIAMMILPIFLVQFIVIKSMFPIILYVAFGLLGVVLFRYKFPVSPAQDFRYFAPMATGVFVLLCTSLSSIRALWIKSIFFVLLYTLVVIQVSYIVRLCLAV